jgi:hypothetical protein
MNETRVRPWVSLPGARGLMRTQNDVILTRVAGQCVTMRGSAFASVTQAAT